MKGPGPTPLLPSKLALKELGESKQTIADYGKATPLAGTAGAPSTVVQLMRGQRGSAK